jgi:hypothetical protein
MDPNASLEACRRLVKALIRQAAEDRQRQESSSRDTLGEELAENFNNLDDWLSRGGTMPRDWRTQ